MASLTRADQLLLRVSTFDAEFQKRYPTQDLYLATSTDGGKTFSKPVMVNDVPK